MRHYIIGIDTGGTFTDGVLIDQRNGHILTTTKVPTTPHRLSDGVGRTLSALLQQSGKTAGEIGGVALSTTLATNSVVEDKGARVALFVIGYVRHFKLPVVAVIYLKGGHTIEGTEEEPLELDYLVSTLEQLTREVDAYAVCSAMSMVNPTHELVAERAISLIDPKPVFCSHRASDQAGMKERAATAALHAKLMPLMESFVHGVEAAIRTLELDCPLFIVTGNGESIEPSEAVSHSGVTVASGPACTALFGERNTSASGLVVDVGGTTTDIALVENGTVVSSPHGCVIGSWTTHIPSVDMFTGGIGGDSLISLQGGQECTLGPARATPLCLAPGVPDPATWLGGDSDNCCCFVPAPDITDIQVQDDQLLACLLAKGPSTISSLSRETGLSHIPLAKQLEGLSRRQLIQQAGFTPTDALHVLDIATFGDRERARSGASVLAARAGCSVEDFCRRVIDRTESLIAELIVQYLAQRSWGTSLNNLLSSRHQHPLLDIAFSLKVPIIGLGAAAPYFLPGAARRLATTVTFPKYHEVGNAIGAAFSIIGKPQNENEEQQ